MPSTSLSHVGNPVLFERHRHLLGLLGALGGRIKNLDFQKLLFLYCQEPATTNIYEFVPYRFGAFSFTSYADRRKLVKRGFLVSDEHYWQLSREGRAAVRDTSASIASFAIRTRALRGDALVAETYRRFPYYAIRSEIAGRVLRGNRAALQKIDSCRPKGEHPVISTIGYEGRSFEAYLNELIKSGVTILCDVRRNPISRKYGFSRRTLANGCEGVGVRYAHFPQLGISSEQRQDLHEQKDYDALFKTYEKKDLPLQARSLRRIHYWMQIGERVALTCYERDSTQCHRRSVAQTIEREFGEEFVARHL